MPFDCSAAPGHGQPGGDRVLVAAQASDERVQGWLVIVVDGGHPLFEISPAPLGHDLGEIADIGAMLTPRATETLGGAVADCPWLRHVVASERVSAMQRLLVGHVGLKHGRVWVADDGDAVAMWTHPDTDGAAAIGARQGFW